MVLALAKRLETIMDYINTIIRIVLLILLILLFLVEFSKIIGVLKRKEITTLEGYALANCAALLLIYASIHESLFTDELLSDCWIYLIAIMACYGFYYFLTLLEAKIESDHIKGNT